MDQGVNNDSQMAGDHLVWTYFSSFLRTKYKGFAIRLFYFSNNTTRMKVYRGIDMIRIIEGKTYEECESKVFQFCNDNSDGLICDNCHRFHKETRPVIDVGVLCDECFEAHCIELRSDPSKGRIYD